jgi:ribosomal protein S18 acetylase RimI-like enzyme
MWRLAKPEDDRELIAMCLELYREDPSPVPVSKLNISQTLIRFREEPLRGRAVVLDMNGVIAGYALLASFWSNELFGEICFIDELYVKPNHRGNGFSQMLISELPNERELWPVRPVAIDLEVTPQNEKARALYAKLGFAPTKNAHMRLPLVSK